MNLKIIEKNSQSHDALMRKPEQLFLANTKVRDELHARELEWARASNPGQNWPAAFGSAVSDGKEIALALLAGPTATGKRNKDGDDLAKRKRQNAETRKQIEALEEQRREFERAAAADRHDPPKTGASSPVTREAEPPTQMDAPTVPDGEQQQMIDEGVVETPPSRAQRLAAFRQAAARLVQRLLRMIASVREEALMGALTSP